MQALNRGFTPQAGETGQVALVLKSEDLSCFDPKIGTWVIPVGEYRCLAHAYAHAMCGSTSQQLAVYCLGTSSSDVFAEIPMAVCGDNPYVISLDTTFSEVVKNPKAAEKMEQFIPWLLSNEGLMILGDRKLRDAMSMIVIGYMLDAVQAEKMLAKLYAELAQI